MAATMEVADISVVVIYFVLVLAVGLHAVRRANRSTVSGYFLAGRSMNWAAVGASLFVSNIGSEHFIGLAGSGAASGLSVSAWELNSIIMLQLLGWVFIPVYIHCGVSTMPEYLSKRFGGKRLKVYFAALSLIMYIFTKLSVNLYSGALFIQESLGWNLYMSVIVLIAMTAVLTVTGGLVAVIYTDTLQAILMITGALCLTAISLVKVGGLQGVMTKYMQSAPNVTAILLSSPNLTYSESCLVHLHPKPDALKVFRHPTDPDMPWPGFVLGQTPVSIWYLFTYSHLDLASCWKSVMICALFPLRVVWALKSGLLFVIIFYSVSIFHIVSIFYMFLILNCKISNGPELLVDLEP